MNVYKFLIPAITWHLILFYLLLGRVPAPEVEGNIPFIDKLAHFCVFALLVFLYKWGFQKLNMQANRNINSGFWSIFIGVAFGGISEILQGMFFEYRSGDIADFMANVVGCMVGLFCYNLLRKTYFVKYL